MKNKLQENISLYQSVKNMTYAQLDAKFEKYINKDSPGYVLPKSGLFKNLKLGKTPLTNDIAYHVITLIDCTENGTLFHDYLDDEYPYPINEAFKKAIDSLESKRRKERVVRALSHYAFQTDDGELLKIKNGDLTSKMPCFIEKVKHSKRLEPCSDMEFLALVNDGYRTRAMSTKNKSSMYSLNSINIRQLVEVDSINNKVIQEVLTRT